VKWIALCIAGLMLAVVAVSSCSINHRSGEYECSNNADCSDGRSCNGGLCVFAGIDAPSPGDGGMKLDAEVCPSQCSSCNPGTRTCTIDCAAGSICSGVVVTCPAGWNCDVRCNTTNSCRSGVNCPTGAFTCNVQCSGNSACRGVMCGAAKCNVMCTGQNSCRGVNCGASCACDVTCTLNNGACSNEVTCNKIQCDTGLGCSSTQFPSCSTCQ
jgi:hypothetical protein